MDDVPETIAEFLRSTCIMRRSPAWLKVDAGLRLVEAGGHLTLHGIERITPGQDVRRAVSFLEPLLPFDREVTVVRFLQVDEDRYADVHLVPSPEGSWIVLLDATEEARAQQLLQQKGNELALLRHQLTRRNEELEKANQRIRGDLEAAARIQVDLLPRLTPAVPGACFAWLFDPCDELAGDTLNIFRLDDEHVAFYVLDVSGHGVPAALSSVMLSRLILPTNDPMSLVGEPDAESSQWRPAAPADVVRRLNALFPTTGTESRYFTLFYGLLNVRTRELSYVNAGQPPPIRLSANAEVSLLEGSGFPIGWFPDSEYEERRITLSSGDRLYACSDGLIEALGPTGEMLGTQRLAQMLVNAFARPLAESLDSLRDRVRSWCRGHLHDDISVVALWIRSLRGRAGTSLEAEVPRGSDSVPNPDRPLGQ